MALPGILAGGAAMPSGSGLAKAGREERARELEQQERDLDGHGL